MAVIFSRVTRTSMVARTERVCLLLVLSAGLTLSALTTQAEAQVRQPTSRLDGQLTELGEKLYELNSRVPELFMQTLKMEGAGTGLHARLFSDPISVLELALERNERNIRARFLLAKCYFAKSLQGEGRWSRSLLTKAEQNFKRVVSDPDKSGLTAKQISESQQMLEEIRKIQGQGELVD